MRCHHGLTARAHLDLSTRETMLAGGDSGLAIEPGSAENSLLAAMISGQEPQMPKEGPPLADDEIAAIRKWIDDGAIWPERRVLTPDAAGETWWSLRPIQRPVVPEVVSDFVRTPIDAFILARLAAAGLTPSSEADRRTLIRRLTFDLHGLPPTPDEIDDFLADDKPDAYERLVDRLLASPRYGERWGRHWLDVVHYGETHGYDKDKRRDNAWPYRDYVIRSFNEDKPYGRFIREQLAGDVLWPDDPTATIATAFIAAGPWDFVGHVELAEGSVEKAKTRLIDRDDMVANIMSTFASVTAHCARCHDHPFDPIPQAEYYRLQAVFAGVDRGDRPYPDPTRPDGAVVYAVQSHPPRPVHVLARGNVEAPREEAAPGALSAVVGPDSVFALSDPNNEGARRAALADWLADERNGLTWRSIVNRLWHYHFGRGLVDTPNDFGRHGERPTHPELLDWLAAEFLDRGQSIKAMHRLIVTSAVYRQSSAHNPASLERDDENRLYWRMNRRRLEAEAVRDAVLSVSGKLELTMGGPSFELFDFKDDHSPHYKYTAVDEPRAWRRSVYRFIVRSVPDPFFETLDFPDPSLNTPVRNTTITALQALVMLNDPFMLRQAEYFAERLASVSNDAAEQVDVAFRLALGRRPSALETAEILELINKFGLTCACRWLFNTNEFEFID